jgi:hypothetical protein
VRGRLNLIFMVLCFYCLMPYISMSLYTADKKFYLSDASSQLYRPGPYYLAKVCAAGTAGPAPALRPQSGAPGLYAARTQRLGPRCYRKCIKRNSPKPGVIQAPFTNPIQPNLRSPPQVAAMTPFQIVCALVYGLTAYGMAGLHHGAVPVLKRSVLDTLMYLIASQVWGGSKRAVERGARKNPPEPAAKAT